MNACYFTNIKIENHQNHYILFSKHFKGEFETFEIYLNNIQSNKSFKGTLSEDAIKSLKTNLEVSEIKKYLIEALKNNSGENSYKYLIENQDFKMKLKFQKNFETENMILNIASVDIQSLSFEDSLKELICTSFFTMDNQALQIINLEKENEMLNKQVNSLTSLVETNIADKNNLETQLYSNFIAILNTKKMKIREMKANTVAHTSMENKNAIPIKIENEIVSIKVEPTTSETIIQQKRIIGKKRKKYNHIEQETKTQIIESANNEDADNTQVLFDSF